MAIKETKAKKKKKKTDLEEISLKPLSLKDFNRKEVEKKINKEKAKINKVLENIDKNLLKISEFLVKSIAFMNITLDSLMDDINEKGVVEEYQNGANQTGYKASVEVSTFNTMIKNYNASVKILFELLAQKGGLGDEETKELTKLLTSGRN